MASEALAMPNSTEKGKKAGRPKQNPLLDLPTAKRPAGKKEKINQTTIINP